MNSLPEGWSVPNQQETGSILQELARELTEQHRLFGQSFDLVAWRDGATDDILLRHTVSEDFYTVLHLTWSHRPENPPWPCIEVQGNFQDFLDYEARFN